MNHNQALKIGSFFVEKLQSTCEFEGPMYINRLCRLVGSVRRLKEDVHDVEILAKPILKSPRPEFGQKKIFRTVFDQVLYELEKSNYLRFEKGKDKLKTYAVNVVKFGIDAASSPFNVEFYCVTPPATWGVLSVIRTGPQDFSHWVVTRKRSGGALPNGYRVQGGAVWEGEKEVKDLAGETPIGFESEKDFLNFLGLGWVEPKDRVAKWSGSARSR